MQQLLCYLYREWISQITPFTQQLLEGRTIQLTSKTHLASQDLQTIQLLLIKNYAQYSPAHLTLKINHRCILLHQRLYKLKHFAQAHLNKGFANVLSAYIDNQLLPVAVEGDREWEGGKGKEGKKRKGEEDIDYSRLVYESSEGSRGKDGAEYVVNIDEVTQLMQLKLVQEQLGTRRQHILKGISYKQGEQQLHRLSFGEMYRTIKENKPKTEAIKQLICQAKEERLQDYILQLFRSHDHAGEQQQNNEVVSRNILLVFNLIKAWPLISEKQALTKSLLSTQQLRKCLNLLLAEGLLDYYPERPSPLYRVTPLAQIQQKFMQRTAQALLNTHYALKNSRSKQKMLRLECMVRQLDDTLLLYGW